MSAAASDGALASVRPYSLTLSVSDLVGMTRWYENKLGMSEVARREYPDFSVSLVFLELNGFRVELIQYDKAQPGIMRPDPPAQIGFLGLTQFAFETSDLAAVRAELEAKNVPIVWQFENPDLGLRFLFIRDPERNLIQFLESIKN